ncbi:hypothetical protein HUJ05_002738 [Dendroctonus ponderosae]|nr:hypothetical protein HUJ05_002738 [Dendroctonus ponderosae]
MEIAKTRRVITLHRRNSSIDETEEVQKLMKLILSTCEYDHTIVGKSKKCLYSVKSDIKHRQFQLAISINYTVRDELSEVPSDSLVMEHDEADEFTIHIARYRPQEIHKLASKTKFTKKEIQLIYRGFKQECPTGMVDEESFIHIFSQFFPLGDATNYAHYVFNTVKQKQTGKISFERQEHAVILIFTVTRRMFRKTALRFSKNIIYSNCPPLRTQNTANVELLFHIGQTKQQLNHTPFWDIQYWYEIPSNNLHSLV